MNYLSSCDGSCGGSPSNDPAGCCGWNGVGATISSDGVHYEDQGIVVHKDDGAGWLGSGSVLKNADGEYVMNFSEEYAHPTPTCSLPTPPATNPLSFSLTPMLLGLPARDCIQPADAYPA